MGADLGQHTTGSHYRTIEKTVSTKIKYLNASRQKEVVITRLRLRKCKLNAYLHQTGKHPDGLCYSCNKPNLKFLASPDPSWSICMPNFKFLVSPVPKIWRRSPFGDMEGSLNSKSTSRKLIATPFTYFPAYVAPGDQYLCQI